MKTQVTFQFETPEEAVAFMAKTFLPEKPKAPAQDGALLTARTSGSALGGAPVAEGQSKRGPGRPPKKAGAGGTPTGSNPVPQPGPAPAPTTPPPVKNPPTEEVRSNVQTPAAGVPVPDAAAVVAALQAVLTAKGMPAAQAIFQRHGVKRGAEVKPEDRAAFIVYCGKVATGEIDPTKAS